jgi:hypothetical protein
MIGVDVDLRPGSYYQEDPSFCGGRRACAIGNLWLAGGIRPRPLGAGFWALPGTGDDRDRARFLAIQPALAGAYAAANAAARVYYDEHPELRAGRGYATMDELMASNWGSELEALFEETDIDDDGMRAVLAAAAATLGTREEATTRVGR